MGFTTRSLAYNPGTNTLSGVAVHNQRIGVHVDGARAPSHWAQSAAADGTWSVVLTGVPSGPRQVQASIGGSSLGPRLSITVP